MEIHMKHTILCNGHIITNLTLRQLAVLTFRLTRRGWDVTYV
jgi:hypothetical protein